MLRKLFKGGNYMRKYGIINPAYHFRVFTGTDNRNACHCIPFLFFRKPETKKGLKFKSFQSDAPKVEYKKTTSARLYPMLGNSANMATTIRQKDESESQGSHRLPTLEQTNKQYPMRYYSWNRL